MFTQCLASCSLLHYSRYTCPMSASSLAFSRASPLAAASHRSPPPHARLRLGQIVPFVIAIHCVDGLVLQPTPRLQTLTAGFLAANSSYPAQQM